MLGRIARSSSSRLAGSSIGRAALCCSTTRGLADNNNSTVNVEHARDTWKTYGNLASYKPGNYHILTFNRISPIGLARFPSDRYDIFPGDGGDDQDVSRSNAHAILLRSHKLQEEEVPHTVRAIAR